MLSNQYPSYNLIVKMLLSMQIEYGKTKIMKIKVYR